MGVSLADARPPPSAVCLGHAQRPSRPLVSRSPCHQRCMGGQSWACCQTVSPYGRSHVRFQVVCGVLRRSTGAETLVVFRRFRSSPIDGGKLAVASRPGLAVCVVFSGAVPAVGWLRFVVPNAVLDTSRSSWPRLPLDVGVKIDADRFGIDYDCR